jgi:CRP-like cAMP-binding protein
MGNYNVTSQIIMLQLVPGNHFGMLALDSSKVQRAASVFTMKETKLLVITKKAFFDVMNQIQKVRDRD